MYCSRIYSIPLHLPAWPNMGGALSQYETIITIPQDAIRRLVIVYCKSNIVACKGSHSNALN